MDLCVKGLQVFLDEKALTPKLNFDFLFPHFYVIQGESGLGKSLLLQALCGILPGELMAFGKSSLDASQLVYVFQDPSSALNPQLNMETHIQEMCTIRNVDFSLALDYMHELDLGQDLLPRFSFELSGGQKQRFAVLLALLSDRKWILLDEVNAGLDAHSCQLLVNIMKRESLQNSRGILWVSHSIQFLQQYADYVLELSDNKLYIKDNIDKPKKNLLFESFTGDKLLLGLENIHFSYSSFTIGPFSLNIHEGERILLTGESGSGKSSLAKIICRTLPFQGSWSMPFVQKSESPIIQKIGWINQESYDSFPPHLVLWKALTDAAYFQKKIKRSERFTLAEEACRAYGLDPVILNKKPHECSGGERQRLAIIRTLLCKPSLLICDEITAHLHADSAASIWNIIEAYLKQSNCAVLLISHRPEEISFPLHKHIEMDKGQLHTIYP